MNVFYLMHRDSKVAAFTMDGDTVLSFECNGGCRELLPIGVHDLVSFRKWIGNRAIPPKRYGTLGRKDSRLGFLLTNNSLSLSDSYWTSPAGVSLSWDAVNLYSNSFLASTILNDFSEADCKEGFSPSSSLNGDMAKKWVIDSDGNRVLVKGSYLPNALQSVSEVLAAKVYSVCDVDFVNYDFTQVVCNGEEKLGCKCKNFTSLDLEFIPAEYIVSAGKKSNDESWYSYFVRVCREHSLDVQHFMDVMLCVDFLIANNDRHLNNFGVLRATDSLQWKRMAPVFDSGNSLFYRNTANSPLPKKEALPGMPVNSFYGTAAKQLKCVRDRGCVVLEKLPSLGELERIVRMDTSLTDYDVEERVRVLGDLRVLFKDFQNGSDVWSYQYQKGCKSEIAKVWH